MLMNTIETHRQIRDGNPAARRTLRMAVASVTLLALAACNTVSGAGKDVSSIGHNVSRGANAAQQGITNTTGASSH
ncbi:hypothetical protein AOE01nite_03550 [Acetobacter oeni]|uniref:Entericidin n=2 Tax=Acetobacter oeni TaxID=304077 RepID=A0A511XGV1_9PROT|nr:hypothetical protein AOE01nite_03550 [Acetobacter oeni]